MAMVVLIPVATTPAAAPEGRPSQSAASPRTSDSTPPLRFTNENLPPRTAADRAHPDPAPVSKRGKKKKKKNKNKTHTSQTDAAARAEMFAQARELREEIAQLENHLAELNKRRQSLRNPYLRGLAKASPAETEAAAGLSTGEHLAWLQAEREKTAASLKEARAKLNALNQS